MDRLKSIRASFGSEWRLIDKNAKQVQRIENRFINRAEREFQQKIAEAISDDGKISADFIEELIIEHMLYTMVNAARSVRHTEYAKDKRLAVPKRTNTIFEIFDRWKKTKKKPPMTKKQVSDMKRIKKEYLEKIQTAYQEVSKRWREGKVGLKDVQRKLEDATKGTSAHVKTIIRTEGTNYDNAVRQNFYKSVPQVTHMLFLSIRDSATTKWCKSRHGKVFEKDSELCDKNRPSVHWNCRSEMVPLSPFNPNHKKMIADPARRPVGLEPLPKEFRKG